MWAGSLTGPPLSPPATAADASAVGRPGTGSGFGSGAGVGWIASMPGLRVSTRTVVPAGR